jgi:negative regulator of replication initiation
MEIGIIAVKKGGRALGESSAWAATSAIEVAKIVTCTHTLCLSDDDAENNVAMGQFISILKALRGGKNPVIPSALTA